MSCGQATQIDVEAFLVEAAADEFESFRAHYPGCPDCAAAVARWSAFELALHDVVDVEGVGSGGHPEPERLEAFLTSAESMGEEAMAIENHVAGCTSCRTELSVLQRFDPDLLWAGAMVESSPHAGVAEDLGGSFRERLRRLVDSFSGGLDFGSAAVPAFAVALLAVLFLWWGGAFERFGRSDLDQRIGTPQLAQQESPTAPRLDPSGPRPPASGPGAGVPDSQAPEDSLRLEERIAKQPEAQPPAGPAERTDPGSVLRPAPEQLAQAAPRQPAFPSPDPKPSPTTPAESAPGEGASEAPREEILLAALTELPLPSYAAPEGAESLGWMRQFGAVRSGATGARVETRAPANHAGLTLSSSPRLWWRVSADTEDAVQLTIVDDEAIEPVLRVELPGPYAAGLYSIDLAQYDVRLEAGIEYRWFVSLLLDPDRPSRNPVSAGALRVIAETDSRRKAATEALPAERGHTLARLGLWYDAYDFFASLAREHPSWSPLAQHRERMMDLARAQN